MEETKKPSTSGPIKVASTFLIVAGFMNFLSAMDILEEQADLGVALSDKSINVGIIGWSIITFIAGWYMGKRKKWAYILAIISNLSLLAFAASIVRINSVAYIYLGLSIFIFLLLIWGRKDFRKV